MICGFNKAETGSQDTYFDQFSTVQNSYDYAYLGIPTGSSNPTSSYFTWPVASRANSTLRDLQMYTPYPTGTERGKLYWVSISAFSTDLLIPDRDKFVELHTPQGNLYYVITPSLNATGSSNTDHIVQYAFADEDDLFANGWRCQRGTPNFSDALASKSNWDSLVNDASWLNPPFNFQPGTTSGDKARIVANVLAYTINSFTLQNTLGLSPGDLVKGAIVLGGATTPFNGDTYRNLVPLVG